MTSTNKLLRNEESYVRLLDGSGLALTSTGGSLNATFGGDVTSALHDSFNVNATLQVKDADLNFGQAVSGSSLPVVVASDQIIPISATTLPLPTNAAEEHAPVGSHGNLASAAALTAAVATSSVDCQHVKALDVFGNSSDGNTFTVQYSMDDTNWYSSIHSANPGAGQDFHIHLPNVGARYVRIMPTGNDTTATITLCGKQ